MSRQTIKIGTQSNDGTGDSIRDAFNKANQNFDELYSLAGAGSGIFFTKSLADTPKTLIPDTLTTASIIGVNTLGNSLTNKLLVASTGISIISTGSSIFISNTKSALITDPAPTLSANLDGNNHYAINFNDPANPRDLATKHYVDSTSFASSINLFVSTSGNDAQTGLTAGRALAYAFRTINKACQYAEELVNSSGIELGPDQKYITYGQTYQNKSTIQNIDNSTSIPGNIVLKVNYTGNGTDPFNENDIHPGSYVKGMTSGAIGFIDGISNVGNDPLQSKYESYDVRVIDQTPPRSFALNEQLMYGTPVSTSNITIMIESGIYDEQYPIRVPRSCSIRGDEFRRVIIRPAPGASTSPWAQIYFCRDETFDGMQIATQRFGYHYLTDPNDVTSTPLQNNEIDVFLMNDQTILRAITGQNHGGFMVVLDPEGQILTKSPYIQNCSSLSRSINTQTFAGGMYIDGAVGNLPAQATNTSTYFTGTTTISVTGLTLRQPQTPSRFVVNGVSYEIDYYTNDFSYNQTTCSRDIGLIVDSMATDLLFTGNGYTQSNFAGLQYWNHTSYVGAFAPEVTATLGAINYISTLSQKVIQLDTSGTRHQSTVTQVTNLPTSTGAIATNIATDFAVITNILNVGTSGVTDAIVSPGLSAISAAQSGYNLLQANKAYIQAEAIAYITDVYPALSYDHDKCYRDVGYMIDCVSFDILYGGNRQAIQAGVYYYGYSSTSTVVANETPAVAVAYRRLRSIVPLIVTNQLVVKTAGNSQTQNVTFPVATSAEGTSLQAMVDLIVNIILNGPSSALAEVPISLTKSNNLNVQQAAAILEANRDFIRAEVIAYINASSGILHLNPNNPGGLNAANGIIPVGSGSGYTVAPAVQFSAPENSGGSVAQGVANIDGNAVTSITITNPGSGYSNPPSVTFIGGTYSVQATLTLTSAALGKGFIGVLPPVIEIGTAGYRSALAADFTQLNDLGYGIVVTNIAFSELVSVFAYFCHVSYYACNGGQIGSSNGAIKYGNYALISKGSDTTEVPIPVRLVNDMITTATVNSNADFWNIDTINTASGTVVYLQKASWPYIPTAKSLLEVDHGNAVDATGKKIGIATYTVAGASTVTTTATIIQVDLLTAGGQGTLQATIPNGTPVNIRGYKSFEISGIDTTTISRPATALDFNESQSIAYRVLTYDNKGSGFAVATFDEGFHYIQMSPYATALPASGATTLHINPLAASVGIGAVISDGQRLFNSVIAGATDPSKQYIFAWNDRIHSITGYTATSVTSATITISPPLSSSMTTSTITLNAGLQANQPAEISTRISILRATGQDFVDVGTGGRETSNIPNDIYGPPRIPRTSSKEVTQVGRGRVFVTATDQDGNFRVGSLFSINQGTGVATISAEISLNNVVSLRLGNGDLVNKFDAQDTTMNPPQPGTVPTQTALVGYIDRRLGRTILGGTPNGGKLGSGYLDLSGIQAMTDTLKTGGNPIDMGSTSTGVIQNLATPTNDYDGANKIYVDQSANLKVAKAGDTMSGALILSTDPTYTDSLLQATTRHYVDIYRQASQLSDVTLTNVADTDLLMFGGALSINTATNKPIWNATRQIVNVTNSSTSDISLTRTGNSLNLQLRSGVIVDADVNSAAAIAQSKLALNPATTILSSAGVNASTLGVAQFDSTFFSATTGATAGWISMYAGPSHASSLLASDASGVVAWQTIANLVSNATVARATTADRLTNARTINGVSFDGSANLTNVPVANALTAGSFLSTSNGTFNGSAAVTFSVNTGVAGSATPNTVVARNGAGDIWANIMNGTATSAQYADLAEKYTSDAEYAPGTVVVFGGDKEITISTQHMDRRVAGVISTDPAHLMNAGIDGLAVALTGRVPCKVVGTIRKGDMLVSSDVPGVAIAELDPKMGTVIGKALEDYTSTEVGVIEVVVGRL